jgi:hypothetical protein
MVRLVGVLVATAAHSGPKLSWTSALAAAALTFVAGVMTTLLTQALQHKAERRRSRCEVAERLSSLAPEVLSGILASDRPTHKERVAAACNAARLRGSPEMQDAGVIVECAFRREEQPPGNILGLTELAAAIDFFARSDCGNDRSNGRGRMRRTARKRYREMLRTERRNFERIVSQQMLKRMFGDAS